MKKVIVYTSCAPKSEKMSSVKWIALFIVFTITSCDYSSVKKGIEGKFQRGTSPQEQTPMGAEEITPVEPLSKMDSIMMLKEQEILRQERKLDSLRRLKKP